MTGLASLMVPVIDAALDRDTLTEEELGTIEEFLDLVDCANV